MMAQIIEAFVCKPFLGDHPGFAFGDVSQGAEAVVLQLIGPVRMVEHVTGYGKLCRFDAGQHS